MGKKIVGIVCDKTVRAATYHGDPMTKDQFYELDDGKAYRMNRKASGSPLHYEHLGVKTKWGKVTRGYFNEKGQWVMEMESDDNEVGEYVANEMIIKNQIVGLSLHHNPFTEDIIEVSLCTEGARPNTGITSIKASAYKQGLPRCPYRTVAASKLSPLVFPEAMSHSFYSSNTLDTSSLNSAAHTQAIGIRNGMSEPNYTNSSDLSALDKEFADFSDTRDLRKKMTEERAREYHANKIKELQEKTKQDYIASVSGGGGQAQPQAPVATNPANVEGLEASKKLFEVANLLRSKGIDDPQIINLLKEANQLHTKTHAEKERLNGDLQSNEKTNKNILDGFVKEHHPSPQTLDPNQPLNSGTIAASLLNYRNYTERLQLDNKYMMQQLQANARQANVDQLAGEFNLYPNQGHTIAASNKRQHMVPATNYAEPASSSRIVDPIIGGHVQDIFASGTPSAGLEGMKTSDWKGL